MVVRTQYSRGEIEAGSLAHLVRFIPMRDSFSEKEGEWCLNNDIRLSLGLGRWQIWMFQHHWLGGNCVNGWSVEVATSWCVEQCGGKWQPQSVSQQTVAAMQEGGCHSPFFTFPGQLPLVTVSSGCLSGTSGDRGQSTSMGGSMLQQL